MIFKMGIWDRSLESNHVGTEIIKRRAISCGAKGARFTYRAVACRVRFLREQRVPRRFVACRAGCEGGGSAGKAAVGGAEGDEGAGGSGDGDLRGEAGPSPQIRG